MKKLTLGVFGANRGNDIFESIMYNDVEIVAICDKDRKLLEKAREKIKDIALYEDFDEFINHGFDAVYIANYFSEHAPYTVKALKKNIHVICECIPAATMVECVELVRAAEQSNAIYMVAENYPYMVFNQEMQRVYKGGTLGKILFGEGEYNHPVSIDNKGFISRYYDSAKHWRNFLPATYYLTHSLGPLMMATHSNPVRVTAMPVYSPKPENAISASYVGDNAAIMTVLNDDNSVFRITGCSLFGARENSYRLACEKGQIENVRGSGNKIMLTYNEWDIPKGKKASNYYTPHFSAEDEEIAGRTGHSGGDYFMFRDFFNCIRNNTAPYLDVYVAVTMSAVGILAHRSLMQFGVPYDIPDFHKEEDRKKYENDKDTPFWGSDGSAPTIPCCSHPDYKPTAEMIERFEKVSKTDW